MGMSKKKAARKYAKIAKRLRRLHGEAASHISRKDNNAVFELYLYFRDVADRIRNEYAVVEYTTPREWGRRMGS